MRTCNLILHCGANAVSRDVVETVATPEPTDTWKPLAHSLVLTRVERLLPVYGLKIVSQAHALTHDGSRYFGLLQVTQGCESAEYTWILGIRNSHDKTFPAGLVVGHQVFVCDNLAFSGEIKVARKHTRFIDRDMPYLMDTAMQKLMGCWNEQDRRIAAYKARSLSDGGAHDLTIRAMDQGVITATQIPAVIKGWREPSHEEFRPRNVWGWFNAVTEALKTTTLATLPPRTERLYGVCDQFANT